MPQQIYLPAGQNLQAKAKRLGRLVDVLVKTSPSKKNSYLQGTPLATSTRPRLLENSPDSRLRPLQPGQQVPGGAPLTVQPLSQSTVAMNRSPDRPLSQLYAQNGVMVSASIAHMPHMPTLPGQPLSRQSFTATPVSVQAEQLKQVVMQQKAGGASAALRTPGEPLNPNWSGAGRSTGVVPFDKSPLRAEAPIFAESSDQQEARTRVPPLPIQVLSQEYQLQATKPEGGSLQEYLEAANIAPGDHSGSGVIQAPSTMDPN